MKTSTMLWIGAAVAVGYYLSKRNADAATGQTTGALAAQGFAAPSTTVQVVIPEIDDNYGPSWGWSSPVWGGRAWRGGGGRHHGHHGGHHGGHH